MQRLQDDTAVALLPAPPVLTGPVGYFQGSVLGGIVTRIRYWWLNMIQEELCGVLTAAGLPLDGSATVLQALQALFAPKGAFGTLRVFTASASWTCPAGVFFAKIRVWAGGGGAGGASGASSVGAGGGGAGYSEGIFAVVPGTNYAVTVGAGGASGGIGGNGAAGGASSFGSLISATPGGGGGGAAAGVIATTVGAGGSGAGGQLSENGVGGGSGIQTGTGSFISGVGGSAFQSPGASFVASNGGTAQNGVPGILPGAGGCGGIAGGGGGAGAGGRVTVEY